jgi:type II secretory pathway component PulF
VPLLEALDGFAQRARRAAARRVLERLAQSLRAGSALSEAMEREFASFPLVYRASVRAGEASGSLGTLLRRLVAHIEWQQEVRATILKALVYPAFLVLALVGLVTLLLTFLIPRIATMYPGGRDALPWPTQVVLIGSDQLRAAAPWLAGIVVLCVCAWFVLRRERRFVEVQDGILLRVPGAGVAATLQAAGCEIGQVIRIAADGCGNAAMAASFRRVGDSIQRGNTMTKGLEDERLTDPFLVQIVAVGESAGDLDGCLERLSTWYDQDVPRRVKRFMALFEPTMLLVSAAIVGFLILAALMPVFGLYESMS